PAQAKALIDRSQSLWARKYILKKKEDAVPGKKRLGFFISVGGTKGEHLFDGAIKTVKYFFDAINVEYAGELLFRQIGVKGEIEKHSEALKQAYQVGQSIVQKMTGDARTT
ncbi:MAG: flavodoxin family protein, partial [Nitrospirota bacterium]